MSRAPPLNKPAGVKDDKTANYDARKRTAAARVGARNYAILLMLQPLSSAGGTNRARSGYLGLIVISTAASGPRTLRSSA